MVAGIPFPDIYDWTWGEIIEFITCRREARIIELKEQAQMDFTKTFLTARVMSGKKGEKFDIMTEYDFLWTKEERAEAKRQRVLKSFRLKGDDNNGK